MPGPAPTYSALFGFTGTLPTRADLIELDAMGSRMNSSQPGTLTLRGFDADGQLVATDTEVIPLGGAQVHLRISAPSFEMVRFTLEPANVYNAFDNIAFTPEPGSAALCAVLTAVAAAHRGRNAHRRHLPQFLRLNRPGASAASAW
jgi:hypothetical protein